MFNALDKGVPVSVPFHSVITLHYRILSIVYTYMQHILPPTVAKSKRFWYKTTHKCTHTQETRTETRNEFR